MILKGMVPAITALLLVPASASPSPPSAQIAVPADPVLYTTRAGDNLYILAQRYFTHVEDYGSGERNRQGVENPSLDRGRRAGRLGTGTA